MGSIAVKTAWVDVDGCRRPLVKRFYTRTALVKRATGGGCDADDGGLIGLHIAQKTPSRPQWIWSSFEQSDMVPPAWPDSPGAFVLNDGKGGADAGEESAVARAAGARAGEAVQRRARCRRADSDGHRADQLRLPATCSPARRGSTTGWSSRSGRGSTATRRTPIPASLDGSVAEHVSRRPARSRRSRTSRWRRSISRACSSAA